MSVPLEAAAVAERIIDDLHARLREAEERAETVRREERAKCAAELRAAVREADLPDVGYALVLTSIGDRLADHWESSP